MTAITRRSAALGGTALALLSLSACGGGGSKTPKAKADCKIKESVLRDRLRGMLLLSAYGDALGAPHELSGLNGNTGFYSPDKGLRRLDDYGRKGQGATPFGVWVDPDGEANKRKQGVPTDDTSIRMALVYPWLCSLKGKAPTEASFRDYLKRVAKGPAGRTEWEKTRKEAAAAIGAAFDDAAAFKKAVKDTNEEAAREAFKPSPGNVFFKPGASVIFGPFFFLELAALTPCCPPEKAFERASGFTCLDQADGRLVSGAFGALMTAAPCPGAKKGDFASFFFKTVGDALKAHGGADGARVQGEMNKARKIGEARRKADKDANRPDPNGFLEEIKEKIYKKGEGEDGALFKFDPVRFLKMFAATLGYSDGDIARTLGLLACSAGDSDTMPALLGSMMGAWCGEAELKKNFMLKKGMDTVERRLREIGRVDIGTLVGCQIAIARNSKCCEIVK